MFKHYLTTALRHFARHKTTTAINICGLALGLMCFLAAHSVASLFKNSDSGFPDAERIYVVTQKYIAPGSNMSIPNSPLTAWPVGHYLQTDIPELAGVARLTNGIESPVRAGDLKSFVRIAYGDAALFDVLSWPLVAGDSKTALRDTRSVVLSEATAKRLFGDATFAIGKSVLVYGNVPLTVTGIVAPPVGFSHIGESSRAINFDMIASMDVLVDNESNAWMRTNWNSPVGFTYLKLPVDGSLTIDALRARLTTFDDRYIPAHEWQAAFDVVPLQGVLIAGLNALIGTEKSGISIIGLLYGLGVVVLLVSALNYANLATAQATLRAKEIGLRRVVGARSSGLALQYIGEAGLLSAMAAVTALLLVSAVVAAMQSASQSFANAFVAFFIQQVPMLLLLVLTVALVAGAYPAFVLSRISVADALRAGKMRAGPRFVPALLVAVQFAATSFLVIAIMVMSAQHRSLEKAAFTRDEDPLVVVSNHLGSSGVQFETLQTELLRQSHVRAVTASMQPPWSMAGALMPLSISPSESARRLTVCNNLVQSNYLATLEIKLIAGRDFDAARADDAVRVEITTNGVRDNVFDGVSAIIDRALADQNGWTPEQAIGKELYLWRPGSAQKAPPAVRIIGVVESKPLRLLGMGATSNIYMYAPHAAVLPLVRIDKRALQAGLKELDAVWSKLAPDIAVKRQFADQVLNDSLKLFTDITRIFRLVAGLALVIAVLGLVGMSLHIIGRRTHEIGVRKTMGASVTKVLLLLLKDFSKPVLIANLIAWPLAFGAMSVYLSIFVTRTSLSFAPFALSLLLTLLIAWSAVVVQATRAARLNPATVLRYE